MPKQIIPYLYDDDAAPFKAYKIVRVLNFI